VCARLGPEASVVKLRHEFVLKALEPFANISALSREYGISRKTAYKWIRRFKEQGIVGLEDISRRPHSSPLRAAGDGRGGPEDPRAEDAVSTLGPKEAPCGAGGLRRRGRGSQRSDLDKLSSPRFIKLTCHGRGVSLREAPSGKMGAVRRLRWGCSSEAAPKRRGRLRASNHRRRVARSGKGGELAYERISRAW